MATPKKQSVKKPPIAKKKITLEKLFPWLLIILGAIGLLASFVLTVEKMNTLSNPTYDPSCNINPILSCGSVMTTEQASIFGITSSLFGVVGFSIIAGIGGVLLTGVTITANWFWRTMLGATALGALFSAYLIFTSIYVITTLCPYCMVVWVVMIALFWYTSTYAIKHKHVPAPNWLQNYASRYHFDTLLLIYGVILLMVLTKFWYYWKTLI